MKFYSNDFSKEISQKIDKVFSEPGQTVTAISSHIPPGWPPGRTHRKLHTAQKHSPKWSSILSTDPNPFWVWLGACFYQFSINNSY